jgi:hypothetical protein
MHEFIFEDDTLKKRIFEKTTKKINKLTDDKYKEAIYFELQDRFENWEGNGKELSNSLQSLNYALNKDKLSDDDKALLYTDVVILSTLTAKDFIL